MLGLALACFARGALHPCTAILHNFVVQGIATASVGAAMKEGSGRCRSLTGKRCAALQKAPMEPTIVVELLRFDLLVKTQRFLQRCVLSSFL